MSYNRDLMPSTMGPKMAPVNMHLPEPLVKRVREEARKAGLSVSAYAATLFQAAWAARFGKSGDPELDRIVAGTLLLHGVGLDNGRIAETLCIEPHIIDRIVQTWTKHQPSLRPKH
jgi:hypothetical protein